MTRFEPREGLDAILAQRVARPRVHRILDLLLDAAKKRAPAARVWVTVRDERVRPSHMDADTQTIPENLRFILDRADGTRDLARRPRDPNLPADQREQCRCDDPTLPAVIRDSIRRSDVDVVGTIASGSIETRFPRIVESHNGTSQDDGVPFMQQAAEEIAARLRAAEA